MNEYSIFRRGSKEFSLGGENLITIGLQEQRYVKGDDIRIFACIQLLQRLSKTNVSNHCGGERNAWMNEWMNKRVNEWNQMQFIALRRTWDVKAFQA